MPFIASEIGRLDQVSTGRTMRFALFLFNFSVFQDLYSKQVYRTTVRPWCHLFIRQQTWQENLNSAAVAGLRMWESR